MSNSSLAVKSRSKSKIRLLFCQLISGLRRQTSHLFSPANRSDRAGASCERVCVIVLLERHSLASTITQQWPVIHTKLAQAGRDGTVLCVCHIWDIFNFNYASVILISRSSDRTGVNIDIVLFRLCLMKTTTFSQSGYKQTACLSCS